jgi:pyrimidine-specific ribonucleoside hydrolase
VLLSGATATRPAAAAGPPAERVVVSADVATGLVGGWRAGISDVDDGLALGMALGASELDVRGVVVTTGNNNLQPQLVVARRIAGELLRRREVPILAGASQRLTDPPVRWYDGRSLDGTCVNDGVRFLARELGARPLTVLALGPLTDVACLLLRFPRAAERLEGVVAIMGRRPGEEFEIGGRRGLTDFNYVMDPRAARVVLESAVPVTFMTFELTSSTLVPRRAVDELGAIGSPAASFFHAATLPWVDFWRDTFHEDGFHPWDQNAVHFAARPSAFDCRPVTPTIVSCGAPPYHDSPDNPCPGHGPNQPSSLDKESSQLWLAPATGPTNTSACAGFASPAARAGFLEDVLAFLR